MPPVHSQCWCKLLVGPFSPGSSFAHTTCKLPPNDDCATPQATGSQTGLSTRGYTHNANTHTETPSVPTTQTDFPKVCSLQNDPSGTLNVPNATTNLTHYWLAPNLMITCESSPISSLVLTGNPLKATGLVLAEIGSLVPTCTYANQRPWQPQVSARISHNYSPPGRSFCPQKLDYCSSGIRPVRTSSWSAS